MFFWIRWLINRFSYRVCSSNHVYGVVIDCNVVFTSVGVTQSLGIANIGNEYRLVQISETLRNKKVSNFNHGSVLFNYFSGDHWPVGQSVGRRNS